MKAQQFTLALTLSRFAVSIVLLLAVLPSGVRPTAAQSQPTILVAPALRQAEGPASAPSRAQVTAHPQSAPATFVENATVTKTVTPTSQVEYGDELTYTLVISAAPGVQIGLYDPLTSTTFTRFVEQPTTGVITHAGGAITGTLTVTPTNQVTVSFVVQVDSPGTPGQTGGVTNRACVYPFGGTLGGCVWSNEVSNLLTRKVYLPLVPRNYTPVQADFIAWPTAGPAPLTVVFTNTSTGAYTASLWAFGNGITSTQTSPTHTYTTPGAYTVTLTVSKLTGSLILPGDTSTLVRPNYITVSDRPAAPSDLQATPIHWSQIQLEWQDNSSDETGFTIYDGTTMTNVGANTISYTVEGLAPSSYHCFLVRAFNDYGDSDWSDWACTTTLPCDEAITNSGFEDDGDWEIPDTAYPAAYTTVVTHSGNRSMRAGIVEPADNIYSHSIAQQTVTIPADTVSATLRFWLYPVSGEPPASLTLPAQPLAATIEEAALADDRQYVLVLDEYDQWIRTLIWQRTDDQQWTSHQFDMGVHAGKTIKLQFGAYNDGWDGITAMYVDDVSLEICGSATCTQRGEDTQRGEERFGIGASDAYWHWIQKNELEKEMK